MDRNKNFKIFAAYFCPAARFWAGIFCSHKYLLMLKTRLLLLLAVSLLANSCVKPKIYRAEVVTRQSAENREKVLVKELLDRKKEASDLIRQVGELNRLIGNQEENIMDLNAELNSRTQQMGESSGKLASEKAALEKELASKNALLGQQKAVLESIQKARRERKNILGEIRTALSQQYADQPEVSFMTEEDRLVISFPDKLLFDQKGLSEISTSGKKLLSSLAQFLSNMPDLDAEIVSHTDNVLPKDKTLIDTWDWSLRRAANTVRVLILDFNVNANQLAPVAKGEYYPLTSNATPEGRQKNRRTEIVLHPKIPAIPGVE